MISSYRTTGYKKRKRPKRKIFLTALIIITAAGGVSYYLFRNPVSSDSLESSQAEQADLFTLWEDQKYEEVNSVCENILKDNPMEVQALSLNGFAYFYRGITKFTLEDQLPLFDRAIINLRKAEIPDSNPYLAQVHYVLGKTYYNKGEYYSDLAIKYLESALELGYTAVDIFEYLGLSYHSIGDYIKALDFFLMAEKTNPSDLLFLAIGQTYVITENYSEAEKYISSAIAATEDQNVIQKGHSLLGQLYMEEEEYTMAMDQYEQILKINPRSADAYYHLGVIYDTINEPVKARSQWRKAVEIEPTHHGALLKLYN